MAQSGSTGSPGQSSRGSAREQDVPQPEHSDENVPNNPTDQSLVCQYRNLLRQTYGESISLTRSNELRLQLRAIENKLISKAFEGINDLIKIQQMKESQCAKLTTRDNYWGDWLPQVRHTLTKLQKAYRSFKQLVSEVKAFHV